MRVTYITCIVGKKHRKIMSRNGSFSSSFTSKTEEDFRDEIMSLKRQLARVKEESKLLKVKLRRSEENAARKEKIICTMIDPMKAHISTKSMRNHSNISSDKGSSVNPVSKTCYQGFCSRAYRHEFGSRTQRDLKCGMISSAGQQRKNRNKKVNLKVTTSMENLSPFHSDSTNFDPHSCNKYGEIVQNIRSCSRSVIDRNDEIVSRDSVDKTKGRECSKTTVAKNRKSGNRKGIPKKKRSEDCSVNEYHQFYSGESMASSPCNSKEINRNFSKEVKLKHVADEFPIDAVICEQCSLRSLRKNTRSAPDCLLENLLFEGKKLVSSWTDSGVFSDKQIETPKVFEALSPDDLCGYSKFDDDQMKEGNEGDDMPHTLSVEGRKGVEHKEHRRDSIFRVDIKKKEPKQETDFIENIDLCQETSLGDYKVEEIDDTDSLRNAADLITEGDSQGVDCGTRNSAVGRFCSFMEMGQMMDSLSIGEQSVSNYEKKPECVNVSVVDDEVEVIDGQSDSNVGNFLDKKKLKLHTD